MVAAGTRARSSPAIDGGRQRFRCAPGLATALLAERASALGAHLDSDPLRYVHRFEDGLDRELVAFLASSLAFGRVSSVFATLDKVLMALGRRPVRSVRRLGEAGLARDLSCVRHRWVAGRDLARVAAAIVSLQDEAGSLERAFVAEPGSFEERLRAFLARIRAGIRGRRSRGVDFLVPDPEGAGANKRVLLFLRWMVRPDDGTDLGQWRLVRPGDLVVPLDTHLAFLGRALGWTRRRTAGWRMALEVTGGLLAIDPQDPVSFDWCLSRIGIVGGCRHAYHAETCARCPVAPWCKAALAEGRRWR